MSARVRMDGGLLDAELLGERMRGKNDPTARRLRDQLWLVCVFVEHRKRVNREERPALTARANRILAALDPEDGRPRRVASGATRRRRKDVAPGGPDQADRAARARVGG